MLVNFAGGPVFPQHPPENPLPAHPEHGGGHPRLGGTPPFSHSSVPSLALGLELLADAETRLRDLGHANNEAIADELADVLARVGRRDIRDFVGVKPDLAFPTAKDGRSEPLLGPEVDHFFAVGWLVGSESGVWRCPEGRGEAGYSSRE